MIVYEVMHKSYIINKVYNLHQTFAEEWQDYSAGQQESRKCIFMFNAVFLTIG